MKKIFKKITIKKILIFITLIFIILEIINISTDIYNFRQLEKAKPILESISKNEKRFYNLKEFNKRYNIDIQPIRNCYIVSNYSGKELYIFGFKLESLIYKYIYGTEYYAYPKYDVPYGQMCVSGIGCYDRNRESFEHTISNPCKE